MSGATPVSDEPSLRLTWIRRVRFGQAALAILASSAACMSASLHPFTQWWFWVASTTSLTIAVAV